jgi:hypothetical protein
MVYPSLPNTMSPQIARRSYKCGADFRVNDVFQSVRNLLKGNKGRQSDCERFWLVFFSVFGGPEDVLLLDIY